MSTQRYTKPRFFEQIGRKMTASLLERFAEDLAAYGVTPPASTDDDGEYFQALGQLSLVPPGFPPDLVEALYGIEAMASPEGKARLMRAASDSGLALEPDQQSTYAEIATQVLLLDPALFARKLAEVRILALSSFEYHACRERLDRRDTFRAPDESALNRIKADIDAWVEQEREGEERVTEIEMYTLEEEYWFLIRRGDCVTRIPTVEGGRVVVRLFRPARDLVIAYSPERDELRVHARSVGEKRMIRRVLGTRLFGDPDHFSVRTAFTLEPLRSEGPDALVVEVDRGIDRILLVELEVRTDDEYDVVSILRANDLFAFAEANGRRAVPNYGRLVRAGFEIYFTGQTKPRTAYLREGNNLRLTRYCDAAAVHRWLGARGFRRREDPGANRLAVNYEDNLVRDRGST